MTDLVAVDSTYRHVAKTCTPGALLTAGSTRIKWYDVARADSPVPTPVRNMARTCLTSEAERTLKGDIGFAVLHRCGTGNDFYFLPLCTWCNSNELWESVYYKDATMRDFAPFIQSGHHRGTLCVWELGPVIHEQRAWVRFLQSARGTRELDDYLTTTFEGVVGA